MISGTFWSWNMQALCQLAHLHGCQHFLRGFSSLCVEGQWKGKQ